MTKEVVTLKPGDSIHVHGKEAMVKRTWYGTDNVTVYIKYMSGAQETRSQFEKVEVVSHA